MKYEEVPLNTLLISPNKTNFIYIITKKEKHIFHNLSYSHNLWIMTKEEVKNWNDDFFVFFSLEVMNEYKYNKYEPLIALFEKGIKDVRK